MIHIPKATRGRKNMTAGRIMFSFGTECDHQRSSCYQVIWFTLADASRKMPGATDKCSAPETSKMTPHLGNEDRKILVTPSFRLSGYSASGKEILTRVVN